MYPCVESTLEISTGNRTLRLWVDVKDIPKNFGLQNYVGEIKDKMISEPEHNKVLEWAILTIPNINAIQILIDYPQSDNEEYGVRFGTVIYTVPFEDVHG